MMFLQFLLTVIISAILYAKGETVASGVRGFARRLAGQQERMRSSCPQRRSKAWRSDRRDRDHPDVHRRHRPRHHRVPAPAVLTAVIFMLCLAQVGPALVLIPAIIWLYAKEGGLWGRSCSSCRSSPSPSTT